MGENWADIGKLFTPMAVSGAVAALEAQFLLPNQKIQIPFIGSVDARVGLGVHTALAQAVGTVGAQYILPNLETGSWAQYKDQIEMFGTPVLVGAADVALLKIAGNPISTQQAFLIGASSSLIGEYVKSALFQ
jgi:hypothetical protein